MFNLLLAATAISSPSLPSLHVNGTDFVDGKGKRVILKGCNVGNWLINEFWMLGTAGKPGTPNDQYQLEKTLTQRFGANADRQLMNTLRRSWMTERDWRNIQTYQFNLVRVPFNYRLLESDDNPEHLRSDAWQWLDTAVDEAEKHGLYVILDMHGVQGGQTMNDHTGRSGQNKLWSAPKNQERMAWLWTQIAKRYRNRSAVIAYDPMNEPYGGTKDEVVSVFKKAYAAIRSVDPEKLIFAHGATDNFDHFGDPRKNGWHNVGFQMHYYPGLFGDAPRIRSTMRHLMFLPTVAAKIKKLDVPFLVGEMNVVLTKSGGAPMMRRFYDAHAEYGWLTTMWSYKVISDTGDTDGGCWGMFTNKYPAKFVNFDKAPESEIDAYFKSFATQELKPYKELLYFLTAKFPKMPPLADDEIPVTKAPAHDELPGWTATDVGDSLPGGLKLNPDGSFNLYGGGDDIWTSSDQFRFLNRPVTGDFDLSVTIDAVEETAGYTKAGLMVRKSLSTNSATAMLSVFPTGDSQIAIRNQDGKNMQGTDGPPGVLPHARFRITRRGSSISFYVGEKEIGSRDLSELGGPVFVGPIALSHSNGELTKISYRDLKFTQ